MTDAQSLLKTFASRKKNIRFREMQKALLDLGFQMRQQRRGGSHFVFKHPKLDILVVLVSHGKNDVLPEYQIVKALRAMEKLITEPGK